MLNRRQMIQQTAFTAAAMTTSGLFAEELMRTPRQTEGPFYPNKLPLDTDNDLLLINDKLSPIVYRSVGIDTPLILYVFPVVMLIFPFTSNFSVGFTVLMPTLPSDSINIRSVVTPPE